MDFSFLKEETLKNLQAISEDDPFFLRDLIELYLKQFESKLPLMENFIKTKNWRELGSLLHLIGSASGNLGAENFHSLCREIERCIRTEDLHSLPSLLPELIPAYRKIYNQLAKLSSKENKRSA